MPEPPARVSGTPAPVRTLLGGVAAVAVLPTAGCGMLSLAPTSEVQADVTVTSPVIVEGEPLPPRFTCAGDGVSPPLQWSGLPEGTQTVAVVLDAPQASGGPMVQWVVSGLDPEQGELAEGQPPGSAAQAVNSAGEVGYNAPCPDGDDDDGGVYRFTVYALSDDPGIAEGAALDEATDAIASRVIGYGRLLAES